MTTHSIGESSCPGCGRTIYAVSNLETERRPKPGDILICDACFCIHTCDESGGPVGFTDGQISELREYWRENPDQAEIFRRIVVVLRFV